MLPSQAPSLTCSRRLTGLALELLDVPFDAASPGSGEVFDHVIDALSEALSRAGAAEQGAFTTDAYRRPSVPAASRGDQRRAQSALRSALAGRRLPGNATSLRQGEERLGAITQELEVLLHRPDDPDGLRHSAALVAAVHADLVDLHTLVRTYTVGYLRLAQSVGVASDTASLEEAAVRAERRLVQALRALCQPI